MICVYLLYNLKLKYVFYRKGLVVFTLRHLCLDRSLFRGDGDLRLVEVV